MTLVPSIETNGEPRILLYYFAFPHYRRSILAELKKLGGSGVEVAAGSEGRENIRPITRAELSFLQELKTVRFGAVSWQTGVVQRAIFGDYTSVVLGPAVASLSTWAILVIRRMLGRQTFLWGQCGRKGERTLKRYLQECMNRLASGLLVYGESEAAAATELGTPTRKIHIVNNATHSNDDRAEVSPSDVYQRMRHRAREATNDGRLTLTFVGRLVDGKRLEVLLDAARELQSQYRGLQVNVIGGGRAEERLRSNYPDDFIHFLGWIYDDDDLNKVVGESTLIVSPYHMGLLAIDALRIGVPVLVPDNPRNGPEVEALTESINSLRFERGNPHAIVDAVNRWLNIAPKILEDQYINARAQALRSWSPEGVAEKILQALR